MTYEGTMVLPRNAIMMDEEEMMYVEGGKKKNTGFSKVSTLTKIGGVGAAISVGTGALAASAGKTAVVASATTIGAVCTMAALPIATAAIYHEAGVTATFGKGHTSSTSLVLHKAIEALCNQTIYSSSIG